MTGRNHLPDGLLAIYIQASRAWSGVGCTYFVWMQSAKLVAPMINAKDARRMGEPSGEGLSVFLPDREIVWRIFLGRIALMGVRVFADILLGRQFGNEGCSNLDRGLGDTELLEFLPWPFRGCEVSSQRCGLPLGRKEKRAPNSIMLTEHVKRSFGGHSCINGIGGLYLSIIKIDWMSRLHVVFWKLKICYVQQSCSATRVFTA